MLQARSLWLRARKQSDDLTAATVPAGTSFFPPRRGNPEVSYVFRRRVGGRAASGGALYAHVAHSVRALAARKPKTNRSSHLNSVSCGVAGKPNWQSASFCGIMSSRSSTPGRCRRSTQAPPQPQRLPPYGAVYHPAVLLAFADGACVEQDGGRPNRCVGVKST
jgi:hypothetical protein